VGVLVELGSINGSTDRGLDTRAESLSITETNDTVVGDLGLDESSRIQLKLGTDFKSNRVSALGVPGSLTGSLDVSVDTVVVRSSKVRKVVGGMDSNGVDGSGISEGGIVAGDLAIENVIGDLTTGDETLVANNGVDGEVGLENVQRSNSVDVRLLVGSIDLGGLLVDGRKKRSQDFQLQALGKVVLELNLSVQVVGGSPSLSEGDALSSVGILGLEVTNDDTRLVVTETVNLEGDTVGGGGLDFELSATDGEILAEKVLAGLANIVESNRNGHL